MARHPRVEYPGVIYHITARGNERRRIFRTEEDRIHFLEVLSESQERYEVILYAYILMTNHYHLCIQTEHPNLSDFMHQLNTAYTVWMNTRNRRKGHLLEGRYKAIAVEEEGYLLSLSGYIHLNPARIKANRNLPVKERMRIVSEYRWSSYSKYVLARDKGEPAVDCDRVWGQLHARSRKDGRSRYRQYIRNWLKKEAAERSKPVARRDMSEYEPLKETRLGCFIGSDQFRDFVQRLLEKDKALSQDLVGYKNWRKGIGLEVLLDLVVQVQGVSIEELKERRRPHPERDLALYLCREVGEKGLRETGELFGIKPSAVTHAVNRVKRRIREKRSYGKRITEARERIIQLLKT